MLLVIAQDRDVSERVMRALESGGHLVDVEWTPAAGLERTRLTPAPDLLIVDLALPHTAGFQIVRDLRQDNNEVPLMAIGGRGDEAERVQAFRLGADQYLARDTGALELIVRVDSLLERVRVRAWPSARPSTRGAYRFGDVEVDPATREVKREGKPVVLAPMELELLLALIRRRGATAARVELLKEVWGYESDVVSRTLDTHVANLRGKLERNPGAPRHILTVRKAGYRLQA